MRKLKQWPEDKDYVPYEDLVTPAKKAYLQAKRIGGGRGAKYDGYGYHSATLPDPDWLFSAEGLEYNKERGRGLLDVLIMAIFNLGFKQGKQSLKREIGTMQRLVKSYEEDIKRGLPPLTPDDKKAAQEAIKKLWEESKNSKEE